MNTPDYNTAVRALLTQARNGIDWDAVLNHLIQTSPDVVAEAVASTSTPTWEETMVAYSLDDNGFVATIREVRNLKGWGLLEAKEWVEQHCPVFERC
jgi:ribosomal protein L7/L12